MKAAWWNCSVGTTHAAGDACRDPRFARMQERIGRAGAAAGGRWRDLGRSIIYYVRT